nr:MAG TPA: hypothetical protein [Caudoviricetes sp.]
MTLLLCRNGRFRIVVFWAEISIVICIKWQNAATVFLIQLDGKRIRSTPNLNPEGYC